MSNVAGVYIIQNKENNKVYVGASVNVDERLWQHKFMLRKNIHHNLHLQSAFNKYGEQSFSFDLLEPCEASLIFSQENYWCNLLCSHNRDYGYNIDPTSPDGKSAISKETKKKMSDSAQKRPVVAYSIYGDFYKEFTDLYKCAEEFKTAAPNVHRKLNIIPSKILIDSRSSMFMFMDKGVDVSSVKDWYSSVFFAISKQEGKYKVYDCFGKFIGSASSRFLCDTLGVGISAITNAVNRKTYIKGLRICK